MKRGRKRGEEYNNREKETRFSMREKRGVKVPCGGRARGDTSIYTPLFPEWIDGGPDLLIWIAHGNSWISMMTNILLTFIYLLGRFVLFLIDGGSNQTSIKNNCLFSKIAQTKKKTKNTNRIVIRVKSSQKITRTNKIDKKKILNDFLHTTSNNKYGRNGFLSFLPFFSRIYNNKYRKHENPIYTLLRVGEMTSFHHFLASADREEPAAGLNPPWISPLFSSLTQKATRRSKGGVHTKIPKELESAVRETAGDPRIGRGTDGKTFSHSSFNTTHTHPREWGGGGGFSHCYIIGSSDLQWHYGWKELSHFWIWPGKCNLAAFLAHLNGWSSSP